MPKDACDTDWITVAEAAKRTRMSAQTIRRAADRGQIAVFETPGGHRRLWADDVDKLIPPTNPHATDKRGQAA